MIRLADGEYHICHFRWTLTLFSLSISIEIMPSNWILTIRWSLNHDHIINVFEQYSNCIADFILINLRVFCLVCFFCSLSAHFINNKYNDFNLQLARIIVAQKCFHFSFSADDTVIRSQYKDGNKTIVVLCTSIVKFLNYKYSISIFAKVFFLLIVVAFVFFFLFFSLILFWLLIFSVFCLLILLFYFSFCFKFEVSLLCIFDSLFCYAK